MGLAALVGLVSFMSVVGLVVLLLVWIRTQLLAPSTYLEPQLPFDFGSTVSSRRCCTDYLYQVIFHRCSNWRIQKSAHRVVVCMQIPRVTNYF